MKFGLITEGISEHRIVKHIISKYFKGQEVYINQIQPPISDGKQSITGGWDKVLDYCQKDELKDILIENDFLIIQIDTDQSQNSPFNIPHLENGIARDPKILYADVLSKLCSLINNEVFIQYVDKIHFAICIHTIECWLLPIYYKDKRKTKIANCTDTLNQILRKKNIKSINTDDKNSSTSNRTYDEILKNFKGKSDIILTSKHNIGFSFFTDSLNTISQQ